MINNQHAAALRAAGVPCFPCTAAKSPAIKKGDDWREVARRDPATLFWPSEVIGVPVPDGVLVIDLDTYKGITRADVDKILGCSPDWDAAHIQDTLNGGQHYAFACDWLARQGSDLEKSQGFDTRAPGRGYIATGGGYRPVGAGVYALVAPHLLPRIPEAARAVLEKTERAPIDQTSIPTGDLQVDIITEALSHLDPGCSRSEWVRTGSALRHHFATNEQAGVALFDKWSAGELWKDGAPHNYDPDNVEGQFYSFKVLGGVTIGSLYYDAARAGWTPPSSIDTSAAFGPGASSDEYETILDEITARGGDPKATNDLVKLIGGSGGNALQRATLAAALSRELNDAKLLTKAVKAVLETLTSSDGPRVEAPPAALPDVVDISDLQATPLVKASSKHLDNALAMIHETFGGRVARYNGGLRWWQGTYWQVIGDEDAGRLALFALWRTQGTIQNAKGTIQALKHVAPKLTTDAQDRRVYFSDCVLDPMTGQTFAHEPNNANLSTLSVPYNGSTPTPVFSQWLRDLFEGFGDFRERVMLLQEIIGWTLIKDNLNVQKFVVLDGASRAGKGALLEIIQALQAPDVTAVAPFYDLGDPKVQNTFRDYDLLFDFEAKGFKGSSSAASFLYSMASNERQSIKQLYANETWRGRLNSKYIIACNGMPVMIDDSGASTNRVQLLYFQRSFKGREDFTLPRKMAAECQGIALWALDGLRRLISQGGKFTQPYSSELAMEQIDEDNRPIKAFLHEHIEIDPEGRALSKDLWHQYRIYMSANNLPASSSRQFYKALKQTVLSMPEVEHITSMRLDGAVGPGYEGLSITNAAESMTATAFKVVDGGKKK